MVIQIKKTITFVFFIHLFFFFLVYIILILLLTCDKGHKLRIFYAPAYSKNSGRALSVTPVRPYVHPSVRTYVRPSVRPSVRPYVPLSCPGHNSKTLWNIFMKLHRCIHHNKTMCHEQGRQLSHFWFLNYFPLT